MVFNIAESDKRKTITQFPREVEKLDHVFVTMSDGCKLAISIWLPKDAKLDPVPALVEYIPYRKNDFTAIRDSVRHPYFAGHGYASIRVDIRGSGDSDGILLDEYLRQEQDDCLELFDWIISQSWSTDSIGMFGKSWGGFSSLQVAARKHKALKTIITLCSTDDRYNDDVHYRGGALMASDMLWWASTMFAYNARPQDPQVVGESWRSNWFERLNTPPNVIAWTTHQTRDEYWKHGSICEDYQRIEIPVWAVGGWKDGYKNPIMRMMQSLPNCYGLIGPWVHEYPEVATPEPNIGFLQLCTQWWDLHLKNKGHFNLPKFTSYIQDPVLPLPSYDTRPGKWVAEDNYPSNNIETMDYYINGPESLSQTLSEAVSSTTSVIKGPQDHGICTGVYCPFGQPGDMPLDQRLDNAKAVVFTSEIITEEFDILGIPYFYADVSSDVDNALLSIRLCDRAPTGESTLLSWGMLNLSHRNSHESPEPLVPGQRYKVRVQLDALGQRIIPGHYLEVALSPNNWPQAWPLPKNVTLTLYHGEHTRLSLPVRKNSRDQDSTIQFPLPEVAPQIQKEIITEEGRTREIKFDVINNIWSIEEESNEGTRRLIHNEVEYGSKNRNKWSIQSSDPLSAQTESHWELTLGRGSSWQTKLLTYSKMSCDADNFYLVNTLEAYENGESVFKRRWENIIKRNFV